MQNLKNIGHLIRAIIDAMYYRFPAGKIIVVGVTGTDGKTTTSNILYEVLSTAGLRTILISTVGVKMTGSVRPLDLHVTTPSSGYIQKELREAVDNGYTHAIIEMTSHGLDQHRTFGINPTIGIVTNITRDHLDYHKTLNNYFLTKMKIFSKAKYAIYSYSEVPLDITPYLKRYTVKLDYQKRRIPSEIKELINSKFPEEFNKKNALAAYCAATILGISDKDILAGIKWYKGVEGRVSKISNKRNLKVFVDFAHTPNALEMILKHVKTLKHKRIIVVFGAAGERDKGKRPIMGATAAKYADCIILTTEDNRSENAERIISEIESGISSSYKGTVIKEINRKMAIDRAINVIAKRGDIVVICGKGHERSLNVNGDELPWNEMDVVKKALNKGL